MSDWSDAPAFMGADTQQSTVDSTQAYKPGYNYLSADAQAVRENMGYGWSPSDFNPTAKGWDDLLQKGFSRAVDVLTLKAIEPEQRSAVARRTQTRLDYQPTIGAVPGAPNWMPILIIGGLVYLFVK